MIQYGLKYKKLKTQDSGFVLFVNRKWADFENDNELRKPQVMTNKNNVFIL